MRLFAFVFALLCSVAQAQEYPTKPVRMLVPFAPGGAVDTTARVLAQAMQARVNWQFVVENRPGGNGFIATTAVAKSAPDGYTLLMAHTGEFAVNPALFDNVPYDLERDFVAITMVSDAPMLYLATASAPFNNFQELVSRRKRSPALSASARRATAASTTSRASGSRRPPASSYCMSLQGRRPAAAAVAAGDVHFGVMAAPGALPHIKSGRGKVIGITTAKKSPLDPSWATPRDAGIPDLDASIWVGLFAPAAADRRSHQRRSARDAQASRCAEALHRERGGEAVGMSSKEFLARIKADAERYKRVVQAGVKPG